MTKNKQVVFKDLGLIDYESGHNFQKKLFNETVELKISNRKREGAELATDNYLIFCQHPHVYTLGRSGDEANLTIPKADLAKIGATFHEIGRGGDITYHGPGQLVGYPILDLDNFFTDIHKYLRLLEEAIILTLKDHSLDGGRIDGLTGVWIDHKKPENGAWNPRKICAMGVKTSRWVTMHGFALNVNPSLEYFSNIVPCGIDDKAVTSMEKELGQKVNFEEVSQRLRNHLASLFEMNLMIDEERYS